MVLYSESLTQTPEKIGGQLSRFEDLKEEEEEDVRKVTVHSNSPITTPRHHPTHPQPSIASTSTSTSTSTYPHSRPRRARSRTSTLIPSVSFTPPPSHPIAMPHSALSPPALPLFDPDQLSRSLEAGPSRLSAPSSGGRRASKSISSGSAMGYGPRPPVSGSSAKRTKSYHHQSQQQQQQQSLPMSPVERTFRLGGSPGLGPVDEDTSGHAGLTRRISTPTLVRRQTFGADLSTLAGGDGGSSWPANDTAQDKPLSRVDSRARSTSTSIVVPQPLGVEPTYVVPPPVLPPYIQRTDSPSRHSQDSGQWAGLNVIPASPEHSPPLPSTTLASPVPDAVDLSARDDFLTRTYNIGESSVRRLAQLVLPVATTEGHVPSRRRASDDSDKQFSIVTIDREDDGESTMSPTTSGSDDAHHLQQADARRGGRYWGLWGSSDSAAEDESGSGYFSLPPTPPDEKPSSDFEAALRSIHGAAEGSGNSLPTPALSNASLSRGNSRRIRKLRKYRFRRPRGEVAGDDEAGQGWFMRMVRGFAGQGGEGQGKTGEVLKELGWTVGVLVGMFLGTLCVAAWLIHGMPITQLKHLPQSTTDLQLLSAEIRSYMGSSDSGWWHTIGVLIFVGCWKHAWSVPGAVVLNILVGSILDPMPALLLLTIITATGSLFSYLLSRPLAPLIAVLFPKPLALVRAALAPDSVPSPPSGSHPHHDSDQGVTPLQLSRDPAAQPIGGPREKPNVWRRLLIMRAMGFVPWSGMNVACGVVGVDWKVFWLTTAAGSASWSYVTASVGNILARLALPTSALSAAAVGESTIQGSESLTSLLRDPVLIAKLVFLSLLTLLPVVLKRRRASAAEDSSSSSSPPSSAVDSRGSSFELASMARGPTRPLVNPALANLRGPSSPPLTPLTQSLAKFTPTPAAFDLLSFGRTAARTGLGMLGSGIRGAMHAVGRVGSSER